MIDKKEVKQAYKNASKTGAIIAYHNLTNNKKYIDIAPNVVSVKNRFEFAKKNVIGLPMTIQNDAKKDMFELEVLEELKKTELQSGLKSFKRNLA